MTSSIIPRFGTYDNSVLPIFNPNFFNWYSNEYATLGDLMKYAKLAGTNFFTGFNNFTNVHIDQTINDISANYIQYIQYIPNIMYEITNINYDEGSETTAIIGNTALEKVCGESLAITKIVNDTIITQNIKTNTLRSKNVVCDTLETKYTSHACVWIDNFPLNKSILRSSIPANNVCKMHVMNHYTVRLYNSLNVCLFEYKNSSEDFTYNININLGEITRINIYHNDFLL